LFVFVFLVILCDSGVRTSGFDCAPAFPPVENKMAALSLSYESHARRLESEKKALMGKLFVKHVFQTYYETSVISPSSGLVRIGGTRLWPAHTYLALSLLARSVVTA